MILETNSFVWNAYAILGMCLGTIVVAIIIALINYYIRRHEKKQDALEAEKKAYNEAIIKTLGELKSSLDSQKSSTDKLENTIKEIVTDFQVVKKDYVQTQKDNEETRLFMMDYFLHFDKFIIDYNKTKDAVINIQENLKQEKKYHLTVELKREFFPSLKDTHLGFHQKNTNVA